MTDSTSHSGVLLSEDPVWGVLSVVFSEYASLTTRLSPFMPFDACPTESGLTGLWFTVFLCGTAVSQVGNRPSPFVTLTTKDWWCQAYYYFNTYMEDGVWLKVTVVIVTYV